MKFENIYKESEENMRLALLSLWTPGSHPMRTAIDQLLTEEPLLAEPAFQSTFGWEPAEDDSWRSYLNPTVIKKLGIGEKYSPYKHQAESWKHLSEGKSIVVTSGTGSGKTECFMYPVISDLYEQGHTNAIEAIFLYPLNALMEDQKKRLSEYCKATGLRFAVYNGDTPEYHADGRDEILPNEVVTREEIRDSKHEGTRPEILLTNPSMLEYILVRQKDQQMLQESAGKLRWIVIDEAHSYSGSAAVELAYQIKRILEAFGRKAEDIRFVCTSATIGGSEGAKSLADFISHVIGQPVSQIQIVGGNRLVRPLDKEKLAHELKANNLPSVEKVLSLRNKINTIPGMTLQQMWEWLCPDISYDRRSKLLPALHLLDQLCEMSQGNNPVLSLRAHFFMRSIEGIFACANPKCKRCNSAQPLYGHLTTNKASVCPDCEAPLLELVQCKRCGGFVLMGTSDSQTHKISSCEDIFNNDDYFSIDLTPEEEEKEDELKLTGNPDTFFLMPYEKDKFFNPVSKANFETSDIEISSEGTILRVSSENNGKWVDVRKDDGHLYCPSCGRLAKGKRLNLKHFRIPINFINQSISPVLLQECAPDKDSWGKYIAFTDSRQGTAISAKTFNINVERIMSRENMVKKLSVVANSNTPQIDLSNIPEQFHAQILSQFKTTTQNGVSLEQISDCLYESHLFEHIAGKENSGDKKAYKAALMRQIIGRKSIYENSAEGMGLITLVYPKLKNIKCPTSLIDYTEIFNCKISDKDWQDFLKIVLDYVFRVGNHIQPLIESERKYVRDANISTPIAAPDDTRPGVSHWPTLAEDNDGVLNKQHRIILLLCAGLGIYSQSDLQSRKKYVSDILNDAWNNLIDNKILTIVKSSNSGYNDSNYYKNNEYVGCYYLDLSGEEGNDVCKIELAKQLKECPVTGQLLDTTFCGYSPMLTGEIDKKLFGKYKCSDQVIKMPVRPKDDDEIEKWEGTNEEIKILKDKGFWSDRHKYTYKHRPVYIAAEHSAQQSKKLLREYTKAFSQKNPSINVLHCSTTMEMGVDIGDIDIVLMDTIPPTAANYLQRVGRAGRMGQTKALAFSLCNNTPVGQHAFANPMWALNAPQKMINVRESKTIIQRHINSFFFRQFVCNNGYGIQATMTIDDFMASTCDTFVQFLDDMSTNTVEKDKFHKVFGDNIEYTINLTKDSIVKIQTDYNAIMKELNDAFCRFEKDDRRRIAIRIQIRKLQDESLLKYLSEHQFIPNANMPTGVVTFDFADKEQSEIIYSLDKRSKEIQKRMSSEKDPVKEASLRAELDSIRKKISDIHQATTATRDIHTALNEYAPEQTVVVNEKNYISAGIKLVGEYKDETQTRAIYHCSYCGHTDYKKILSENEHCPKCHNPYHGIIDKDHSSYTLAYEPVGFRTDQNVFSSREEKTEKQYYDIRPVLLDTDWTRHTDINMCEIIGSEEADKILFYNVGRGYGFAFCKRCGRAAVENAPVTTNNETIPNAVKPGHKSLWWGPECEANNTDIARHVVFTGMHPTCYTVLRFKKDAGSLEYENDEQLAYSLGVILKRALAKSEGIDESEIDFGTKPEKNAWILYIYDTAKGGCGYSLKLKNSVLCQEVFDLARQELEDSSCSCHIEGGACTKCLIDRNNYKYAHLLSKAKALDWLNKQKNKALDVPNSVKEISPSAKVVYQSLKDIVKQSIKDVNVNKITLCVSDLSNDIIVTDWSSIRSEMGKYINTAISNGKKIELIVEYHSEIHTSLSDKLPFINLKDRFSDCDVRFVKDMGKMKTAIIVEMSDKIQKYFTDMETALSFSNNWGKDCSHVFVDSTKTNFISQEQPTYTELPSQVIREGITNISMFNVRNYFSKAIAPFVLKDGDTETLTEILKDKHIVITFSDMYVNSALASLMLVYLIDEMKIIFGFTIDQITLQLDSPKRKCNNDRFNEWTPISMNFPCKEDADNYTDTLFQQILGITPDHATTDADHHRWLRLETKTGDCIEIRPDHGISGGYRSDSKYMNLNSLSGSVNVVRNNEDILYYVIIKKANK